MELSYLLRGAKINTGSAQGKERVYFTCHPDDFEKYFDSICMDIFKTQSCAIYFSTDISNQRKDADIDIDLGQMQLFVIPITAKFLREDCKARNVDLEFAKEHHIPILPLMQEFGLESEFNRICGELQYLEKHQSDITAIPYDKKLEKYLKAVLLGDELAAKVRAAFDAYIFLSYRKKDRRYAQELMRLIHKNDFCRDIAIWYDEFLTPGENFNTAIREAMDKSKLFALAVTPNLINEENYVMTTEYPAARDMGMTILPAEMVPTDIAELKKKYNGIPDTVDSRSDEALSFELSKVFYEQVEKLARAENDNDPRHLFFIGLAYLSGIDVEVDREYAMRLLKRAADMEYLPAMEKMADIYYSGGIVQYDLAKTIAWQEKIVDAYIKKEGTKHPDSVKAMQRLALYYNRIGQNSKAAHLIESILKTEIEVNGKESPDALEAMSNLMYFYLGTEMLGKNQNRLLRLALKALELSINAFGREDPRTLPVMYNVALCYTWMDRKNKALDIFETILNIEKQHLEEDDPQILTLMNCIASCWSDAGLHEKAIQISERIVEIRTRVLGEGHPDTINEMRNLSSYYNKSGRKDESQELLDEAMRKGGAVELGLFLDSILEDFDHSFSEDIDFEFFEKCYGISEEDFKYPMELTLSGCNYLMGSGVEQDFEYALTQLTEAAELNYLPAMELVAQIYGGEIVNGFDYDAAIEWQTRVVSQYISDYGETHNDTLEAIRKLEEYCRSAKRTAEAIDACGKLLEIQMRIFGEKNEETRSTADRLQEYSGPAESPIEAIEVRGRILEIQKRIFGKMHMQTLVSIVRLEKYYSRMSADKVKNAEICEKIFQTEKLVLGYDHPKTLAFMSNLASCYNDIGRNTEAIEICEKAVDGQKSVLGSNHRDTLSSMFGLATFYSSANQTEKAIEICETVVDMRKLTLGKTSIMTIASMLALAGYYNDAGQISRSIEICEEIFDTQQEALGDDRALALPYTDNLAYYYARSGRMDEAIEFYEKIVSCKKRMLNEGHPNTVMALQSLAHCYDTTGQREKEIALYEDLLIIQKKVLGKDHPDVIKTQNKINQLKC